MQEWAEQEIEIAKQTAGANDKYYSACLDCALEAYKVLCSQEHSGMSISVTAQILNALIGGKPLSPIYDESEIWDRVSHSKETYQCSRYSGLFKDVFITADGSMQNITYSDVNRFVCHEPETPNLPFHSGLVTRTLDKLFPITMPYYPERIDVTVYETLVDPNKGDYDTVHIVSAKFPNGDKVDINLYFTEDDNGEFQSISFEQYQSLLTHAKHCTHSGVEDAEI